MRRSFLALPALALLALPFAPAEAQQTRVYSSCGGSSWTANDLSRPLQLLPDGRLCISGTISASLAGFAPNGNFTTLTATAASSASTALPAGTDVAFQNLSSIDVSCVLTAGASTATTNKIIVRAGATVFLSVGSATTAACINQTGSASNVVALMGGTGLGTNFGGASAGGGGGGAATIADGADVNQGAIADAASTAGSTGTLSAKLRLMTSQLNTILTNLGSPFQAGGALAANQSVNITQVLGAANSATNGLFVRAGSGQFASGAYAAGSLAAGAAVDGWDLTQGAIADASVTAGATGSISAKLRRISADIDSIKTSASTPLDNSSAVINVSTATVTQLVAISASTLVRVTAFSVIAGGTGQFKFVYGTGTNCATGKTDLTGSYELTAQAGIAMGSGIATLFKGAAGNALCIETTAAVNMRGHLTYNQF